MKKSIFFMLTFFFAVLLVACTKDERKDQHIDTNHEGMEEMKHMSHQGQANGQKD